VVLSGTPTAGTATFTVNVTDTAGAKLSKDYSLTVNPVLGIGPAALATASVGTATDQTITVTSGTKPYTTFNVTAFVAGGTGLTQAANLTLNAAAGTVVLSGTPTGTGTAKFTVNVTDTAGRILTKNYSLRVDLGFGGSDIRVDVRSEIRESGTNSTVFVDVPGASVDVVVPAGTTRLFIARFEGESACFGPDAAPFGYCTLAIIARNTASGASTAFDPAGSGNFVFDTNPDGPADDAWESNAMERSKRLGPGSFRIRLMWRVTNAETTFTLDDWHFSVETRE
jgi:hypothetical protein